MPAQSSKKPLIEKLGIKPNLTIFILNPPEDYVKALGQLPHRVRLATTLKGPLDFIHFFVKKKSELEKMFPLFNAGTSAQRSTLGFMTKSFRKCGN